MRAGCCPPTCPPKPWRRLLSFLSILLVLGVATSASAHAFVQRYDLPVPLWYYLAGAGVVVALTFVMLAIRRDYTVRGPRSVDISQTLIGRIVTSDSLGRSLAILSVLVFVFLLLAGLFGAQEDPFANILPAFVWVGWWVGLAFVCALLGNVWPAINPWAAVAKLFGPLVDWQSRRSDPSWMGVWPAVGLYLCFAWAELVWPDNAVPASLATLILIYSAITWGGMARYGIDRWLRCGETFSVVFGLFGRFAPVASEADGRVVLRLYGAGLVSEEKVSVSMVVLVVGLLATVSFDGFLHTPTWGQLYAGASHVLYDLGWVQSLGNTGARTLIVTVGLLMASLSFMVVFTGVCQLVAMITIREEPGARPRAFDVAARHALTLVPIAIAYHLAHYLWLLVTEGQRLYGHISDPFGVGWDLFGTAGMIPDTSVVDARFLWLFSLGVIVVGHAIAVWLGHVAIQRESRNRHEALLSQIPMLVLMIGYTMLSLWIIGQPIVEV